MVQAYWHVGRLIVEAQGGEERAAYGDGLIRELAKRLTADFGKGFTTTNLKNMRTFYLTFQTSPKVQAPPPRSWVTSSNLGSIGQDCGSNRLA